ncbi:NAD(P)H-binding protein [Kribbella sp. NPDC056951]|uniref:NAD(P)H-binding protein n=1 Tax=Kribbella sp. NPDC056951 TaxID=3345978 RepID=UPI00364365D0
MILLTGANGVVGRAVARQLVDKGIPLTAVTRGASPVPNTVQGDLFNPGWLEPTLEGVEAIQISPRATGPGLGELLQLASKQGVSRAVLLSATTVEHPAGEPRFAAQFKAAEELVKDSGLDWTILRLADFAANALAWAPQIKAGDVVRGAYATATTSPVHEADIAAVAVQALADKAHAGSTLTLTGPQPLDQSAKVRIIGAAIGRPLAFQELPADQVRQAMLAQCLPDEVPARLLGSLADYATHPGPTTETVAALLGRPALTFTDWARDNAPAFGA